MNDAAVEPRSSRRTSRRVGYVIAAIVNGVLLVVVNNLLAWELLPFLTEEFERILPIVNVSLVVSLLLNLAYLAYDAPWFKSLTQAIVAGIGLAVAIATLRVFPFDFSQYRVNWEAVTRAILILAVVGTSIGLIAETGRFIAAVVRAGETPAR